MKKGTIVKILVGVSTVLALVFAYGVDRKIIDFNNPQQTIKNIKSHKENLNEEKKQQLEKEIKEKRELLTTIYDINSNHQVTQEDEIKFQKLTSTILGDISYFNCSVELTSKVNGTTIKYVLTPLKVLPFLGNGISGKISNNKYRVSVSFLLNTKSFGGKLMPINQTRLAHIDIILAENKFTVTEDNMNYFEIGKALSRDIYQNESQSPYSMFGEWESLQKESDGSYNFTINFPDYKKAVFKFNMMENILKVTRVQ